MIDSLSSGWRHIKGTRLSRRRNLGVRGSGGFTLLEVVLAISIAIGVLVVVLFFYRQAADLRTQLLQETERISTVRLVLERLTADLRSARSDFNTGQGLSGDSTSLQFVKTDLIPRAAWTGGALGRPSAAPTDQKMVSYGVASGIEGTNTVVTGLTRTERPLVEPRELPESKRTNQVVTQSETDVRRSPEPLTDMIRFVRFRYWDGSSWVDAWRDLELPQGIEVSLGSEPLPEDASPDDYPFELFRRVICLPGYGVSSSLAVFSDLMEEPASPSEEITSKPETP